MESHRLESRHEAAARLNIDVAAGWSDKMGGVGAHVPGGTPLRLGFERSVTHVYKRPELWRQEGGMKGAYSALVLWTLFVVVKTEPGPKTEPAGVLTQWEEHFFPFSEADKWVADPR